MINEGRVLYLSHFYPPAPQHFITDEVVSWRRSGLSLQVLAIKPPPIRDLVRPEDQVELSQAVYLGRLSIGTWWRGLRVCLQRPFRTAAAFGKVLLSPYPRSDSLRMRLHSLLTCFRSVGVMGFVVQHGFKRVHCDFPDDTTTIAWILARLGIVDYSFGDHFSYNTQLFREKISDSQFVIVCSEKNREALEELLPGAASKIHTRYLGVDLEKWTPCPMPESPLIVSVGTLQEKKGQVYLLRAARLLLDEGLDATYLLVGDGPDRSTLEHEIARLGLTHCVKITGYVSEGEVRRLICQSRAMCLPCVESSNGDTDGIPVALMEAMASGKPCVSSRIGGIEELIEDAANGYLVPQREPAAVASSLRALISDVGKASEMGRAARATAERMLDISKGAAVTATLFREADKHD